MKLPGLILAALVLTYSAASAQTQPVTKRAVVRPDSPLQAKALTEHIGTATVRKQFFVAYGGQVNVTFFMRSDGGHQTNAQVYFGGAEKCSATTSSATYNKFGCTGEIAAGGLVEIYLFPNGQEGAIRNARLWFSLVNVPTPAVTLDD